MIHESSEEIFTINSYIQKYIPSLEDLTSDTLLSELHSQLKLAFVYSSYDMTVRETLADHL